MPSRLLSFASAGIVAVARQHAERGRFRVAIGEAETLGTQAAPENLAHRRGPARHALVEAPRIECLELFLAEHDLEPFAPQEIRSHFPSPIETRS
jgi:hypothetical protein